MQIGFWVLKAGATLLAFAGCTRAPAQPATPCLPFTAGTHPSSIAKQPAPFASATLAPLTSAPAEGRVTDSPLSLVLRTCDWTGPIEAHPFEGGAVVVQRSLIAVVAKDTVRQDPLWLGGLPEFVNWDARTILLLPSLQAGGLDLPKGTVLSVSAGNLRGPSRIQRWEGRRWVKASDAYVPSDPRVLALRDAPGLEASAALATGDLFIVRDENGTDNALVRNAYVFGPKSMKPAKYSLPRGEGDRSYRLSLAIATPTLAFICAIPHSIQRFLDGTWTSIDLPGATPESCAATADGSLWVVANTTQTRRLSLLRFTPSGVWDTVDMPPNVSPQLIWARGNRVWVSAEHAEVPARGGARNRFELYSNVAVVNPMEVGELQVPTLDFEGISGLDLDSVDVPSVSDAPAGPGTRACSSLVVYLGKIATPELRATLAEFPDAVAHHLFHVVGTSPGKVAYRHIAGRAVGSVRPSMQTLAAVALVPTDFEQGMRLVESIAVQVPGSSPRLLCAVPNVSRSEILAAPASEPLDSKIP